MGPMQGRGLQGHQGQRAPVPHPAHLSPDPLRPPGQTGLTWYLHPRSRSPPRPQGRAGLTDTGTNRLRSPPDGSRSENSALRGSSQPPAPSTGPPDIPFLPSMGASTWPPDIPSFPVWGASLGLWLHRSCTRITTGPEVGSCLPGSSPPPGWAPWVRPGKNGPLTAS